MRAFAISKYLVGGSAIGALLVCASPALADVQYTNFTVANDVNVTLTCNSIPNCTSGYYGSGQIALYDNNPNPEALIWCVDVTHDLRGPWTHSPGNNTYTFAVTHWQSEGNGLSNIWSGGAVGVGSQLTNHVVGELGALAAYGDANINSNNYMSSAVQLAIWDVEYNGGALNLDGALKEVSDSPQTQALAETLVADVTHGLLGSDTNIDWLTCVSDERVCNQGQLEVLGPSEVPEPASLLLFASGFAGLGGFMAFGRRRRSQAARG